MAVNWRDIQEQAVTFAARYADAADEDKWAKSFWHELFGIFGIHPRDIGSFEERVKVHGRPGVGKIDYFSPRHFIIEQKSRGKSLKEAYLQALTYYESLPSELRPRHIIVCDFEHMVIHDLEAKGKKREMTIRLADLPKQIKRLSFLVGEEASEAKPEEPIDVKAVRAIGKLYDALRANNYPSEHLPHLLTRLVFLFFADDTEIFDNDSIRRYLESETKPDGSDIGTHLAAIFQVLDTPEDKRQSTLVPALSNLRYVNGGLFKDVLPVAFASRQVRDTILACCAFDWSGVSPAIFGSMFQSVMDEKARHDVGAHYTSEKNILKVIGPLFLDELKEELENAKTSGEKLRALQDKLATITLLDPACGCGNFLVVSYRELRRIENEIIARLHHKTSAAKVEAGHVVLPLGVDLKTLSKLSVERMYGIEIEPFPAEVAKLSLWLVDHLMNQELGALFGKPLTKLPLTEAPHIVCGNALRLDWEAVVPKEKLSYILGNPPFLGSRVMDEKQKAEMHEIFPEVREVGFLDYVTAWYMKAANLMRGSTIRAAFVSTNSISQGEQPGILWDALRPLGMHIRFAHRTFKWTNEASGKAAVYCVVIGFGAEEMAKPQLFEYPNISGDPVVTHAKQINPYLVAGPEDVVIRNRQKPLCDVPDISFGNMPRDGGGFVLSPEERTALLAEEPAAEQFVRSYVGAEEFLNGGERYCLWLVDATPEQMRAMPLVMRRVQTVKTFREMSVAASTRKMAETPYLFAQRTQKNTNYIIVPKVSSERRAYIPIGFMPPSVIASDLCFMIPGASLYHFGILESEMHMAWMRAVAGRLKSDYRYSKDIVYNNFPWPENPSEEQKRRVEECAQVVLDARAAHPAATLADLYDPNTMPADLLKAHHTLDRAVDACYGKRSFKDEPERLEFLFERYKALVAKEEPRR